MKVIPTVDQMMLTGVYCIRNTVNGKKYIGSASMSFRKRLCEHRRLLRNGSHHSRHLQRAWSKCGECVFEFSILRVTLPHEAVEYEQAFVDLYKSADSKYGYNVAPIAGSCRGVKHTAQFRLTVSKRAKTRLSNPGAREAVSKWMKAYYADPAARLSSSRTAKAYYARPGVRAEHSKRRKKYFADNPEACLLQSQRVKARFANPEERMRISQQRKEYYASNPEARTKSGDRFKAYHAAHPEARIEQGKLQSQRMKELNNDPIRKAIRIAKGDATRLQNKIAKASAMLSII